MTIEGYVNCIIFRNENNGYTVATINTSSESVDCVGIMPFIKEGDNARITGEPINHPKYGEQFKVDVYEKLLPVTEAGIKEYLSSGIIKGLGRKQASSIVTRFGLDSLNILKNDPALLAQIRGISLDKALRYGAEYKEMTFLEDFTQFMQGYGVDPLKSKAVYEVYQEKAMETVLENPYILTLNEFDISFPVADKIAGASGLEGENPCRLMSGVEYTLLKAAENGHVYLPESRLLRAAKKLLGTDDVPIHEALSQLSELNKIVTVKDGEDDRIFLYQYFEAEQTVAHGLSTLCQAVIPLPEKDVKDLLSEFVSKSNIILADMQFQAVLQSSQNGVFVITGGPGTGKTTIIRAIIYIFERIGMTVQLAAPTGKAAKRLSLAADHEAGTIHRLLEPLFSSADSSITFVRDENNPIEGDVVILDEVSMIDILLMRDLLNAVSPGTRLILAGDSDQLPSVGAGSVLDDLLSSGIIPHVRLTEVFRQASESMIVVNAHKINRGIFPDINIKNKDFFFLKVSGADNISNTIANLCKDRIPKAYNLTSVNQIQVLTPTRKGVTGSRSLNERLQTALNPQKIQNPAVTEKEWNGFTFRVGDKVMQTKNNYNLPWEKHVGEFQEGTGVFNGDTGILTEIESKSEHLQVTFDDDRIVRYDFSLIDELEPAYAMTVHKSQGSEFSVVVMPICKIHNMLMTRNLLYTAITRAKDLVVLVGEEKYLNYMIMNNKEQFRYSMLDELLRACENRNDND